MLVYFTVKGVLRLQLELGAHVRSYVLRGKIPPHSVGLFLLRFEFALIPEWTFFGVCNAGAALAFGVRAGAASAAARAAAASAAAACAPARAAAVEGARTGEARPAARTWASRPPRPP